MTIRTLSSLLEALKTHLSAEDGRISMDSLLEAFHERGFGLVIFIFAIPMALPVPKPPGISSIFAVPLIILTVQQAVGRHTVWLPLFIRRKAIDRAKLASLLAKGLPWIQKAEHLIRPRLEVITTDRITRIVGLLGAIMSLCIMVPLPGTNTVPGMGIVLMSIGIMMRDGLAIIAGAILGMTWIVFLVAAYSWFGMEGLNALRSAL
ncbi:MAG TPA: exopolysaccharide biosynthesis protein [Micavibrio sp.]|jgi:hypothetical protein